MRLEPRLVLAPNVLAPSTTSGAPLGIIAGSLNLSGPLAVTVLDTPTPASTSPFQVTVATSAGTASVGSPAGVTVAGDGTNSLQIQGSLGDINAALTGLVYTNATASGTPATITVTAADGSGTPLTDTKVIYVRVADATVAPTISSVLADVAYTAETAATPVARTAIPVVVADPQGATGLVVTATSDNPNLIPNNSTYIAITGTSPNFSLTLKTATGISGTARITVKVADTNSNFTTKSFAVTVNPFQPSAPYWGTLAGRNSSSGSVGFTDGTGQGATFTNPNGLVSDPTGNLYVQDRNLIRRISPLGVVTTLAGSTATTTRVDGVGAAAGIVNDFNNKRMAVSPDGNTLYFLNGGFLRKLDINPQSPDFRKVTTLSGGGASAASDVNGSLAQATFPYSTTANVYGGLAISADGNTLYVAELGRDGLRQVDLVGGTVSKLSIDGSTNYSLQATSIGEYTTGKIFFVTNAVGTTAAYQNGVFALDLATGVTTKLFASNGGSLSSFSDYSVFAWNANKGYFGGFIQGQFHQVAPNGTVISTQGVTNSGLGFNAGYTPSFFSSYSGRVGLAVSPDGNFALSQGNDSTTSTVLGNIRGVTPQPSMYNPGAQSTPRETPIVFNDGALEKMGAFANATPAGQVLPVTYTASVSNGTLSFGGVPLPAGLTLSGLGTSAISLVGEDAVLNGYLANLTYTPNIGYMNVNASGGSLATPASPDVMNISAATAFGTVSGSFNILVKATDNAPVISPPFANQNYIAGTAQVTEPVINFTIADADTALTSFVNNATTGARITATSSNPNLFTAATMASAIGGTGAARTLTLKHEAGITGSATITVLISDGTNQNTYTFRVTVTPSPYVLSVDTLAGNADANAGAGYTDATGTAAKFTNPLGAVTDSRGLTYVLDNNLIRSISNSGVVTTLAGATTRTTRVDGVGVAAGFATPGSGEYVASAVSPDNNWLYLTNGGWLRRMGINPSDSANYLKVTSLIALTAPTGYSPMVTYGGGLVFSGDGNSIFLAPNTGGGAIKIQRFDLTASPVTVSNLALDGNPNNTILPVFMTKGPNNTAYMITHPNSAFGSPGYSNKFFSLNLATGALTAMAQNPFAADTQMVFGGVYNPLTNDLLVDNGSVAPRIVDGTTGALKFTLPTNNTTNIYSNGVGGTFNASDAISIYNGIYYLSQNGYGVNNIRNIRAVKPAPGLYNPGSQVFTEGQANAFSSVDLQKMGVQANGATSITYTLTALYGTVNVSTVAGLTGVSGRGTKSISFTGSEADLNAALATLTYTPDTGFINATTAGVQISGAPLETLSFSATGTGSDGTALGGSTATLSVLVKAANNSPRILTPLTDRTYLVENAISTETAISFTIADADTANTSFVNNATTGARITATSDNPNLLLAADMATAIGGTGAARTITLKHQAGITGAANVTVTINDGTNFRTYQFKVTVLPSPSYYWGILAGSAAGTAGFANNTGTSAMFNAPSGMALDPDGNLVVADNTNFRIRKVTPAGVVTTLIGSGVDGYNNAGASATVNNATNPLQAIIASLNAMAVGPNRDIYFSDTWTNAPSSNIPRLRVTRWDTATNAYKQTLTLSETIPWSTSAMLVAPDNSGLYLANSQFIQKFNFSDSTYTVIAGVANTNGTADGTGANATFTNIAGISFDSNNDILVNQQNGAIRKVTPQGVVTTINPDQTASLSASNVLQLGSGAYLRSSMSWSGLMYSANGDTAMIAGTGPGGSVVGLNLTATFNSIKTIVPGANGLIYLVSQGANNIRVGTPYPTLLNPGAQSTTMGTRLAFSSADLQQLGAVSNAVDSNNAPLPITLTLSAGFGTLDFNSVAPPNGVTVNFGTGNRSVTISGNETAVNTYLRNLGYTPDAGYLNANASGGALASGAVAPDVLSMSVTTANNTATPVTGSLNLLVRGDNTPRIISALPNRTYYAEAGIATESAITLLLADGDTAATAFVNNATTGARITATSTNPNLILAADMATAVGGTGNARTLTLKHQAGITGTATVTITINDGTNQSTYTFTVTVVPTPNYYWGLLAGSPAGTAGSANGTGTAATFNAPNGLVRDSQGNLFVTDYNNQVIRKITPQGVVTTFAGTLGSFGFADGTGTAAKFNYPIGLAVDSQDNLYVADQNNNRIRKVTPQGVVTTVAGTGTASLVDGAAASATFNLPSGVAVSPTGVLYVGDRNNYAIRKIENGQVTTLAGNGTSGLVDGVGSAARFNAPGWVALTPAGMLLVRDINNTGAVRQVDPTSGAVTTLYSATANTWGGLAVDASGLVYAAQAANIISLISSFDSTPLMGNGTASSVLGINTAATSADTRQMAFAPDGTIYFTSFGQNNIRTGTPYPSLMNPGAQWTNESTRLAFNSASLTQLGAISNGLDVNGNPLPITLTLSAQFGTLDFNNVAAPNGVTATFAPGNRSVTLVGDASAINTYLLNFGYRPDTGYINAKADGTALASGAVSPDVLSMSVTTANNTANPVTGSLNLQVRATDNKPRILTPLPARTYYVEPGVVGESAISFTIGDADTLATAFQNNATTGARIVATSDNQNLIVAADMATSIGGTGTARTISLKHQGNITGVANVTILINDGTNQNTYTFKVTVVPTPNYYWGILAGSPAGTAGSANGTGTAATLNGPVGMVRDSQGNLFVTEFGGHSIRKITPQGVVTTFAGLPGTAGSADGTGSAARFNTPSQLAIDSSDNLYVADKFNHKFRKITPAGVVTTLAGTGVQGASDGAALSATFGFPDAIAVTPSGVVYVGDTNYHTIRKIENGQVTTIAGASGVSGTTDGIGSAARFYWPTRLSVMPDGNLLEKDQWTGLTRTINVTTFEVKTLFTGATNSLATPNVDPVGNLYIPLVDNKLTLVSPFDSVDLVGTGTAGSTLGVNTNATVGVTTTAIFNQDGSIYLADYSRHNIRTGTPIASLANPGKQVVVDSQLLTFSNPDKQRLAIQSNGAAEPLSLTLAVTKGMISLSQTTGLTFTAGDGTADATMTFSGTVADINAALNNLVYDFDEVANPSTTSDTLTMSNPWTVGGTSGTTTQVVPLQIVKAPVVSAITNILVALGGTLPTRAFTMVDGDNSPSQVQFTFTSSNTSLLPLSGIVLNPGTGAGSTTVGATGNYSLAFTPTANRTGSSIVTVTATDPTGISSTRSFAVTVSPTVGAPDLIPASDTGSSSTDNVTGDTTPTFAVSLGAGLQAGDVVAIYSGNTKIGEATVTSADILAGAVQITAGTLADGNYSSITASVMFGTTRGVTSAALAPQLVIDTTAPVAGGAPDLQAASDTGSSSTDNVTNDTTPTFSIPLAGSGAAAGDVVELYNGTTLLGSYTLTAGDISANSASMTLSTLPAGTYSDVKFRLVDGAGNASGFSGSLSPALVIDTGAPLLTAVSPADNASNILPPTTLVMTFNENVTKGSTGTIVIKKVSDGSTVETFNVATSSRIMVSGNKVTLTPATALEYGTGYYVVVDSTALTDLAANAFAGLSQATDWNFTTLSAPTFVDLVAASDTGASSTDNFTNLANISLDVGLSAGAAVGDVIRLYDGLALVGTVTVDATMLAANKVTFNLTGQADGVHSYTATLFTAGVESVATAALLVTIDTSAPSVPTLGLDPASDTGIPGDGKTKDNTPTLTGTAEPGATVNLLIDGATTPVTVVADAQGKWSYTPTTPLADGPHSVVATQTDKAGNTSGNSTPLPFTIDSTPPVPTVFSPADDSTNISPPSAISITFNEPIFRGSFGSITIWDDTTNTSLVIPASSSQISISGNVLTITPTTPFAPSTSYHVEIGLGVIRDEQANLFAGISNATDWNFTTNNSPASPAIDLQAASDTGFSSTDNKTNLATLAFDITVPAGAVAGDVIKVYDGQTLVSAGTLSGADVTAGTVVAILTGVTAGSHSYTTTLTRTSDSLVSDPSPALVVDVNTTQPSAPTINPLGPTNDNTPTMNGTAPANSKVDLYDANNNLIGTANADANGNWSFTPTSPLPDGSYQLNAKATDAYGNTSPASSPINLVIDTVPPAKPVIAAVGPDNGASTSDRITSAAVLTIAGTAEPNSLVTVYDNGVKLGTATANGSGQWTFTTISLNDGSHRFTADATDASGNRSVESDPSAMLIDSSAPAAPVINPLPSPTGDNTPILSGKGEPGATVTVFDGSNPIGSAVVDANGDWTFTPSTPLSEGSHNFTAEQKDAAGNTSPLSNQVSGVIDSVPPAAPAITPPAGPTNDSTPAISGTAEPNSTVKVYEGTTLLGTAIADGSGNWTFTPSTPLADGPHSLSATATDAAGNVSPISGKVAFVVDTAAPIDTVLAPAGGATDASIYDNLVVTFSEPVVLGGTGVIELRLADGTLVESFSVNSTRLTLSGNTLTIDPTDYLVSNTGYYVTIASGTVRDAAGNNYAGLTNATDWAFTTSALPIPPAPSGVDLQPASDTGRSNADNITSDNTPTLDIALNTSGLFAGDIVHLYADGVEVGSATLTADDIAAGKVSITTTALADGVLSLTAKVSDANGTFSSASAPLSVTIDTTPPVAPGVPDLVAASDTGASSSDDITSVNTPTFTGTGTPGDTISLFVDGVLAGTGVVDANGVYTITPASPIADGVHSITSQATDAAGLTGPMSSALSVTIDNTPPATPTSPADLTTASDTGLSSTDNITSDTTPDFSGAGLTPGDTVVLYVDGSPVGTATVDQNGNWTVNASPALIDGSHTVTYLVKDPAGNISGFAPPMTVVVDTAVPAKPTALTLDPASDTGLSLTDRVTKDNTPTINGSGGTPGFRVTLLDGSSNVIGTAIVGPDGKWSITPATPLADGTYAFTAEYTSISGVTGPASDPLSVVIDTVAPSAPSAPTISPINPSATAAHTNSTSPVFIGGGMTPGSLVELFADGSTTPVGTAIVDAFGNYQVISSTLADGPHSFAVKVTDAAGNTSPASQPTSLVIDSRLPGSPTTPDLTAATDTGRSATDNITSDNTPDFQGVVDATSNALPGDFVEIYSGNTLVGVGTVVLDALTGDLVWKVTVGTAPNGYSQSLGATSLTDGVQAISAAFRTPGGTLSAPSQALTVTVDTSAPNAPSAAPDLIAASDTGTSSTDNLTNDTTPSFSGTGGRPGDTVNLYANGNLIGSAVVGPDGSYTVTPTNPLADGTYNFTTNYVDAAGNTSPFSAPLNNVVIDSTPPAVPPVPDLVASSDTGASSTDNLTSDTTPTFEGFGTPGETIRIYVDGVLAGTTTVDVNGNWSLTTNSIADGVHQVTAQALDAAGNASAQSTPLALTIDTTPPDAPVFTTPSGPTDNSLPPISGTGEPGAVIRLYEGSSLIGTAIVNADGSWTITPSAPLADGSHSFTATATDGAGNTSPLSQPINVTIDTVDPLAPAVISVSQDTGDPSDKYTSDNTLTITGTAEPGSTVNVYDGTTVVGTAVVGPDGRYSVTTSVLPDGIYPLSISAVDAAGNESQPTSIGTWTIDTRAPNAPTVGSVSQDTGNPTDKNTSDNTLTITGGPGSAEPGATITVYDSSSGTPVAVGTATVQPDGSYSVTTSVLADGQHPLAVTQTDKAGNESQPTSIGTWTIDTGVPAAPRVDSVSDDTEVPGDRITRDTTLTVTGGPGSAEPGSTITIYDSSSGTPVAVGTATVQPDGSYSVTTSVLADGQHPLAVTQTDRAGNESQPASIGTWTIIALPTMTISNATVSENSPYAIVRVSLSQPASAAIQFTPVVSSIPSVGGSGSATVGTDVSGTIEYFNGTAWVSAAGGVTIPGGATGVLLRVAVINDTLSETSEVVAIGTGPVTNVLNPAGVFGTITIRDDATGDLFSGSNSSGTPDAPGTGGLPLQLDDDRPIVVSDTGEVNEKSAFAMFRVLGQEGQLVSLTLTSGSATLGTDFRNALQYFDGSAWVSYVPGSYVAIPAAPVAPQAFTAARGMGRSAAASVMSSPTVQSLPGLLLVRVPIVQDTTYENSESYTLQANTTGNVTAADTGTILDNGNGAIFLPTNTSGIPDSPGTPGYPASLDNDMPLVVTATEADCGPGAQVFVMNPFTGAVRYQFPVFEPGFRGGARVAVGDVDGDGVDEIVVASGPGRVGEIRVYEADGTELIGYRTQPFGSKYTGGVEVVAGDVDADGDDDLIAVASRGPGSTAVFRVTPTAGDPVENQPFKAYAAFDRKVTAGGTVAAADLNNDGRIEIIHGSGPGADPRVNVFDVSAAPRLVDSFTPFAGLRKYTGGVAVATTMFNNDATPDILVAGGRGAGSVVEVYDGTVNARVANARLDSARLAAFADLASRNAAVYATAVDTDGDGVADRIFAAQAAGGSGAGIRSVTKGGAVAETFPAIRKNLRIAAARPKRPL